MADEIEELGLLSLIILSDEEDRNTSFKQLIVLLYNFRASTVGLNQIQSTFMPHLVRSANRFADS